MGPYFQRPVGKRKGLQIDNLIMRRDKVWTIMEYKYHTTPVGMSVVEEVSRKIERLPVPVNTSVEKVLIAAAGVTKEVKQSNFFNCFEQRESWRLFKPPTPRFLREPEVNPGSHPDLRDAHGDSRPFIEEGNLRLQPVPAGE